MGATVAIIVPDLMFQSRIGATAEALGLASVVADTPDAVRDALALRPAVVVLDLQAAGIDALAAVRDAVAAGARVLAFGRHTEPATLRAARDAGAALAVPRSQFIDELPQLLESMLARPSVDGG